MECHGNRQETRIGTDGNARNIFEREETGGVITPSGKTGRKGCNLWQASRKR
jgi:hypothetical protein